MALEQQPYQPRFAAIDFETATEKRGSACSIGVAIVDRGRVDSVEARLIRPPTQDFQFTYVHGLRWMDVEHAPTFDKVWSELAPALSGVEFFCAHNASFDRGVFNACCARYGLTRPAKRFVCTVELARSQWRIYPTKLPDVCRRLKIPLNHHEAGSDAKACARIVLAAAKNGWRWRRKARRRWKAKRKRPSAGRSRRQRR